MKHHRGQLAGVDLRCIRALADGVVLAELTAQIAAREEYRARAVAPGERRFLAEVRREGGDARPTPDAAGAGMSRAVHPATARAQVAGGEMGGGLPGSHGQVSRAMQGEIDGGRRHRGVPPGAPPVERQAARRRETVVLGAVCMRCPPFGGRRPAPLTRRSLGRARCARCGRTDAGRLRSPGSWRTPVRAA